MGVLPDQVQGHLKNTHKQSIKINDSQFHQVLEEMDVCDGFPEVPAPSIDEDARPPYGGKRRRSQPTHFFLTTICIFILIL